MEEVASHWPLKGNIIDTCKFVLRKEFWEKETMRIELCVNYIVVSDSKKKKRLFGCKVWHMKGSSRKTS